MSTCMKRKKVFTLKKKKRQIKLNKVKLVEHVDCCTAVEGEETEQDNFSNFHWKNKNKNKNMFHTVRPVFFLQLQHFSSSLSNQPDDVLKIRNKQTKKSLKSYNKMLQRPTRYVTHLQNRDYRYI